MKQVFVQISKKIKVQNMILTLVITGLSFSFIGCNKKSGEPFDIPTSFQEQKSQFYDSDIQDNMIIMVGETKHYSLTFAKDGFSNDEIESIKVKIAGSLNQIYKKTKEFPKDNIDVYVFPDSKFQGFNSNENKVFCSASDIESGDYRYQLVQSYFGVSNPCISLGLTGYINDKEYDRDILKTYFSKEENIELLHLFGPRFMKDWNEKEDYEMAEMTAISLTKFTIQEKGIEKLTDIDETVKNAWLKEIGSPFTYRENDIKYNNFQYAQSENHVKIFTDDARYNIDKTEFFNTAKQIENLVVTQIKWKKELKEYLQIYAPEYYNSHDFDMTIPYILKKRNSSEERNNANNNIITVLNVDDTVFHELGHIFFPSPLQWGNMKSDGIADYASLILCPYDRRREWYSNIILEDRNHDKYLPYGESVKLYYEGYCKKDNYSNSEINIEYLIDALAIATLKKEYFSELYPFSKSINDVYKIESDIEGNELTYIQSCSFISYLCKGYSFDTVLSYCTTSNTCEEVFQKGYEELKHEWLDYLER
ncbi:hypothetical protein [Anaerocolumna aminovalerica]|uniref:hypothetical protein n=1 Tax=Anaerocolumna aminovalerica TaxID=1527 RepID=UPI00248AD762|nr:hypothetical protein [Anaerocolumna aminovalerica]